MSIFIRARSDDKNRPFVRAKELHEHGNWAEAVQMYEQALEVEPDRWGILVEASVCLAQLERFDEAEHNLDRALELEPSLAETLDWYRKNFRLRKLVFGFPKLERVTDITPILDVIRRQDDEDVQRAIGNLITDELFLSKVLWRGKLDDSAVPQLLDAMKDENRDVRFSVAAKLGIMKYLPAVDLLITGLQDNYFPVRGVSATALGEIGDKRARPALEKAAAEDREEVVRNNAREALRKLA